MSESHNNGHLGLHLKELRARSARRRRVRNAVWLLPSVTVVVLLAADADQCGVERQALIEDWPR